MPWLYRRCWSSSRWFRWRRAASIWESILPAVLVEVGYPQAADLEAIRLDLDAAGYESAQVQYFGEDDVVLVRLPPMPGEIDEIREQLADAIKGDDERIQLRRVSTVSPQVGDELAEKGALAMISRC